MTLRYPILCTAIVILAFLSSCKESDRTVGTSKATSSASQNEPLKELDWLVGNWEDVADNINVNYHFYWNFNNHVLIQNFTVKSPEHSTLDGQQWIVWDPSSKSLRSWIVDSDGGFGESVWYKEGDSWFASTAFTLADGRKASATHVYTKIDNNTFTFASEGRDIGGVVLPNIGPFKVVRKR